MYISTATIKMKTVHFHAQILHGLALSLLGLSKGTLKRKLL